MYCGVNSSVYLRSAGSKLHMAVSYSAVILCSALLAAASSWQDKASQIASRTHRVGSCLHQVADFTGAYVHAMALIKKHGNVREQDPVVEVRREFAHALERTVTWFHKGGFAQKAAKYAAALPLASMDPKPSHIASAFRALTDFVRLRRKVSAPGSLKDE